MEDKKESKRKERKKRRRTRRERGGKAVGRSLCVPNG